ncbi:branched-chain amino acid ABC transporter permease [Rhodoligotrophos ferricapiens]|uniref:branched-chain amino acid ABC transporter permease n=1 Tax=Rhodoligotrophos ferricapiens TaxID=3069264 RepID=UPI00315DB6DC
MSTFVQLLINAVQIGAIYVLFSLGLTLIFGVMRIINFAHGEFFSLTALLISVQVGWLTSQVGLPPWADYLLAFAVALVVLLIISVLVFRFGFAHYLGDMTSGFILSLGLVLIMQGGMLELFGGYPRSVPALVEGSITVLGGAISLQKLLICALALAATGAILFMVMRTPLGVSLRAVAEDQEAAMLQGIRYRRIALYGFLIGSALAALAGGLIAPLAVILPSMGGEFLIKAFMIVIIGGLGSIPGAILASFLLAAIESFGSFYVDLPTATIGMFVLVAVVLVLRPQGLLGRVVR